MAAEAIISGIVAQLTAITFEKASEAWRVVSGIEKEVKRLESNFKAIQYEVEDAEEKQYMDKRVKHWLDKIKQVSYDMEDVLDDWKTALQELQTASATFVPNCKVCLCVSCFSFGSKMVRRHDIAIKIKKINEELDQIVNDKNKFELIKREIIKQPKRPESTSFADVSELLGRDSVKESIIRILLCEEGSRNIPTITLVGMGGMGKTSLAQLIYNDHRIQTHFSKTIWVCASDPFDQSQIARAILADLDPDSTRFLPIPTPFQTLLVKIREKIAAEKFFFVLDDVWTDRDEDWESLKAIFNYGMFGSWILVTTRKESVARQMESPHVFHLKLLSEQICWLILAQKAFTGRNKNNISRENLEDIGREIAKKCNGSPLAAKTLGGLLQDKLRKEEWQNVLNSEIWKSDFAQEIFTPLLLSYYDLPSTIRQCLSYCAIFPKRYKIGKDELIQHWMAQGYLNSDDNLQRELKGEDYFEYLATRSFFQDFEEDGNGNIIFCKMHDMVHDFVQFLTEYGFATEEIVEDLTLDLSSKKARHLRLLIENCSSFPESICGTEKFRSLVAVSHRWGGAIATTKALRNLFSRSKRLRLLEFDSFHLNTKEIPHEIGTLIHLRYLSLISCSGIEILPEAVCELTNLQSLNLRKCHSLEKLPVGIGKLMNLRYLCTKGCNGLNYYPKGISNLTSLVRLSNIKTRAVRNDANEFSIGDLKNLDLLGGNLCVELIGDAIDWDEAQRARLHKKIHLKGMDIWICSPHISKEEVVQALTPPPNLHVELFDYQRWREEKLHAAVIVPKPAFRDATVSGIAGKNTSDPKK